MITFKQYITESEYEDILSNQRQKEGLQAALKDPETNKIYVGKSHQDAYNSAPPDAQKRLYSYIDMRTKNFSRTSIAGFVNDKGRWQTRRETEKSHGADHAEGLKALGHIKEMILESFDQEKIHKNPPLESLKNIVGGGGNKYRFITTKKGDLFATNAFNYTHVDMKRKLGLETEDAEAEGYIYHDKGQYSYMSFIPGKVSHNPNPVKQFKDMRRAGHSSIPVEEV